MFISIHLFMLSSLKFVVWTLTGALLHLEFFSFLVILLCSGSLSYCLIQSGPTELLVSHLTLEYFGIRDFKSHSKAGADAAKQAQ